MSKNEPRVNDNALAWLRLAVGLLFLTLAQYKLWGTEFTHGGFQDSIRQFLHGGAYPFVVPLLRNLVLPHLAFTAHLVAYGELCIGLALLFGVMVRTASFFGLIYMITLFLASSYPGPHAAVWRYVTGGLGQLGFAFCFVAFGMGDAARVWSLSSLHRRNLRRLAQQQMGSGESGLASSNVFGK